MCILARPATCMPAEHRCRQCCMTKEVPDLIMTCAAQCPLTCTYALQTICRFCPGRPVLLTAVTMHDARDKRRLISCYCADGVIHNRSYAHMAELTGMQCSTAVVLLQLCHVCIAPANAHCYRYLCVKFCSGPTRKACSVPHFWTN